MKSFTVTAYELLGYWEINKVVYYSFGKLKRSMPDMKESTVIRITRIGTSPDQCFHIYFLLV